MKPKEAIYYLAAIENKYIHGGDEYYDKQRRKALHLAMDALYKQITIKPKKTESKILLGMGWFYECPVCGCECGENEYHPESTDNEEYCKQCGKSLDWS